MKSMRMPPLTMAHVRDHAGRRHITRSVTRLLTVAVASAVLVATGTGPADASGWPGVAVGVHTAARTSTSFTVALDVAPNATWYRVTASTVESDIYYANINRYSPQRVTTGAAAPRIYVPVGYTSATYYYRVATINGPIIRWSSAYQYVHLMPPVPTRLGVTVGSSGTYLAWWSPSTTGFGIQQATDAAFTTGQRIYTTTDNTRRFTPYDLRAGVRYWFRVRASNGLVLSSFGPAVTAVPMSSPQHLRVLTYNTLSVNYDGNIENGSVLAPWSQRRAGVVSLLSGASADVITVQEAGGNVATSGNYVREVDSIASGLGSGYALANTDHGSNPGPNQNSPYMSNYVLYNRSTVTPLGPGGHWMIGYSVSTAYQLFRANSSGATFLYLGTHLTSVRGPVGDSERKIEVDNMIALARAYASSHGVTSTIYGGDMNSWPDRYLTLDTPGLEMQTHLISDAFGAAQTHYNAQYGSINGYFRQAPLGGSADRLFVSSGTAVRAWGQLLDLSYGAFVGVIPSDHNPVYADIDLP